MTTLTVKRLRELLHYDPETGVFTRLVTLGRTAKVGMVAGSPSDDRGYIKIRVDGTYYKAHHLAWLYMTGEWPKGRIDHKDVTPSNNSWGNLRPATHSQNQANRRLSRNSSSGLKGARWHKRDKRWQSSICVNRKYIHLGTFGSAWEAHLAYVEAANKYFGEFARAA